MQNVGSRKKVNRQFPHHFSVSCYLIQQQILMSFSNLTHKTTDNNYEAMIVSYDQIHIGPAISYCLGKCRSNPLFDNS